ncbi:UbiX family flavin prenyltransferase [Alloscardovia macacae]|uniref:Polyprenyl P-hydroxybenzoate and phenylacrylic acid decarboxylase n=1 Tax=Alloscardovia macacae TaxID=1160091 RepID=A0A261F706_9BIFI|nr:UbiX family flavin prenyltransferase [Alloscardovia macacae]OZG54939.1 polyprenyl P-hydroxybenzoate and phenylacrylic acid decarboxylase [Alloscardovia macacae]
MKRIIVGATGASGLPLLIDVLRIIRENADDGWRSTLILSDSSQTTLQWETGLSVSDVRELADDWYEPTEIGARPASGSYPTAGMVVVPCSMKTLAGIHSGYAENLLLRAADVTIKEQRPLVLCTRESPLSPIHLRNMQELSSIPGVRIMPPVMNFYGHYTSIEEMTYSIAARLLSPFGITASGYQGWEGLEER